MRMLTKLSFQFFQKIHAAGIITAWPHVPVLICHVMDA